MSLTPSTFILKINDQAPDFTLMDTNQETWKLKDFKSSKGLVVAFLSNHCPYVKHLANHLAKLSNEYMDKGISFIGINSNDIENYPDDSPELMKKEVQLRGYKFPYLFDETQEVAKLYSAACTPDFFIFNSELRLYYTGRYDDSTPGNNKPVTGNDLKNALDSLLKNETPPKEQLPSFGCNIKWKQGNEPKYFTPKK